MPPKFINKGDLVSVVIAGKVFIMPVDGFYDGNRSILLLLTPTGFLVSCAAHQVKAIHGTDKNVIHLFNKERPPICSQPSRSSSSSSGKQ